MDKRQELEVGIFHDLYNRARVLPVTSRMGRLGVDRHAWHFTSLWAAIKILGKTRSVAATPEPSDIWLTNAAFLNDRKELRHAKEILDEAISKTTADGEFASRVQEIIEREIAISNVYVFSMCFGRDVGFEWDQLSQWRAYGQNGRGVALGFKFPGIGPPMPPYLHLGEVWYDPTLHRQIVDFVLSTVPTYERGGYWTRDELIEFSASFLMRVAPLMKDRGFEEENELRITYRLPASDGPEVKFREREGVAIPYVSLNDIYKTARVVPPCRYGFMEIETVAVGPSEDNDLWVQTLRLAAAQAGVTLSVEKSGIPYRVF